MQKWIYIGSGIVVLAGLLLGGLAFWAPGSLEGLPIASEWLAGSTTTLEEDESADDQKKVEQRPGDEGARKRADKQKGPYEPTSKYIADGFDPDERVIDFSESKVRSKKEGPRLDVLTTNDVQRIVYDRANSLIPCYQKVLDKRPDAGGDVGFEFGIDSDGEVLMVRITDSELRSKVAEDCLVEKTRNWDFPKTNLDFVTRFQTSMLFRMQ